MDYKQQLELMVRKTDILTRLRVYQARDFDSPWLEGRYYYSLKQNPAIVLNFNQQ